MRVADEHTPLPRPRCTHGLEVSMQKFETIVLGLGAMGSASLFQLAKRGNKVLGIDQFAPPHRFGSTHGDTRITRVAIGENEQSTLLARRSHEIWREIEAETSEGLLTTNGCLVLSSDAPRAPRMWKISSKIPSGRRSVTAFRTSA